MGVVNAIDVEQRAHGIEVELRMQRDAVVENAEAQIRILPAEDIKATRRRRRSRDKEHGTEIATGRRVERARPCGKRDGADPSDEERALIEYAAELIAGSDGPEADAALAERLLRRAKEAGR